MNLEEATKVLESLEELSPDIEDFSRGPSYELARKRQNDAIKIIKKQIKELKQNKKENDLGVGHLDSLDICEQCGEETYIWYMAGGGECKNPECNHSDICF